MGRGAGQAVANHLSKESMDAAFRADVASKEASQDSMLGLCLMPFRYGLLLFVGLSFYRAWLVALVLSVGHVTMNALAVSVLKLQTLNNERLLHLAAAWTRDGLEPAPSRMTPQLIAQAERILPWVSPKLWSKPEVGVHPERLLDGSGTLALLQCHARDSYVLGGSIQSSQFRVLLKEGSTSEDQVCGWFHAFLARRRLLASSQAPCTSSLIDAIVASHAEAVADFPGFFAALLAAGWQVDEARMRSGSSVLLNAGPWRLQAKAE